MIWHYVMTLWYDIMIWHYDMTLWYDIMIWYIIWTDSIHIKKPQTVEHEYRCGFGCQSCQHPSNLNPLPQSLTRLPPSHNPLPQATLLSPTHRPYPQAQYNGFLRCFPAEGNQGIRHKFRQAGGVRHRTSSQDKDKRVAFLRNFAVELVVWKHAHPSKDNKIKWSSLTRCPYTDKLNKK